MSGDDPDITKESAAEPDSGEPGSVAQTEPPAIPKANENILDRPLDQGMLSLSFDPTELGLCPMSVEMLVVDQPAPSDLYLFSVDDNDIVTHIHRRRVLGLVLAAQYRSNLRRQSA